VDFDHNRNSEPSDEASEQKHNFNQSDVGGLEKNYYSNQNDVVSEHNCNFSQSDAALG